MSSRPLRVGFVGAGFSATFQAESLLKVHTQPVELAAVTANSPTSAATFARRFGIPAVYRSVTELLRDRDIDAVCICVPNAAHAEIVISAAEAGKHIICEKPLTGAFPISRPGTTPTERAHAEQQTSHHNIAAIVDAVTTAGVIFCYAENWVYAPAFTKMARLLALSGGPVLDIRAEQSHSGSHAVRSRRRSSSGGGALLMLGSHPIGAALHLKNRVAQDAGLRPARPVSVTGETANLHDSAITRPDHQWLVSDWEDVETWASIVIGFDDSTKAVVTASFAQLGGIRNSLAVHTTNAVLRANITPNDSLEIYTPDPEAFGTEHLQEKLEARTGWISASSDERWEQGYRQEMQDFVDAIVAGQQPLANLQLAAGVVEIVYAAYRSAAEGRRILLPSLSHPTID